MKAALLSEKSAKVIRKVPHFKTVLVTGAASYLGSKLCEALLSQDFRVVGWDTVAPQLSNPRFIHFRADLNEAWPKELQSVDYIFHLAANEPHLEVQEKSGLRTFLTNTEGTKKLLEFASLCQATFLLGSTVEIYKGAFSAHNIEDYFGDTDEEKSHNSFLSAKKFAESLVWEYLKAEKLNVRIARLPHVYGPGFMADKPTYHLAQFLASLQNREPLAIYGSGLSRESYGFIDDTIDGLIKVMFDPDSAGRIYPLCELESVTTLELAYLVKSFGSNRTEVEFLPAVEREYPDYQIIDGQTQKDLGWAPKVSLKEGIGRTLKGELGHHGAEIPKLRQGIIPPLPTSEVKSAETSEVDGGIGELAKLKSPPLPTVPKDFLDTPKVKTEKPARKPTKLLSSFFTLALVLFLLPPILLAGNLALGARNLYRSVTLAQNLDFKKAAALSSNAASEFERALGIQSAFGKVTGTTLFNLSTTGLYSSQTLAFETSGLNVLNQAASALSPQSPASPPTQQDFISAAASFSKGFERFQLLQGELKNISLGTLPQIFRSTFSKITSSEDTLRLNLQTLSELSQGLPEALGLLSPKKYLVLLQNNEELRATGGFIGSYAVVAVDKGKIKDLKVDDVYNLDGILAEKKLGVPAPQEFQKYLKNEVLYLRDSNFDPDFTQSAALSKKLYESATKEAVDGVLALNLTVFKDILAQTGPLSVVGTADPITAKNLFEKSIFYSEKEYFPGSTAKKSFLGNLSQALLEKMLRDPQNFFRLSSSSIYQNLEAKNLLFYLPQSSLQSTFAKRSWDGSLRQNLGGDFFMLVEENLGANKANFTTLRSIKYEVKEINRERELGGKVTLSYTNEAEQEQWPLGTYKFFASIIANPQTTAAEGLNFYKELKPKETWIKEINLTLPKTLKGGSYKLYVQKQPGLENVPFTFIYTPILGGKAFSHEGYLTKDLEFSVQ